MNKYLKIILLILLIIIPFNVNGLTKNEIIYVNIDSTGKVTKTTVTNQLSNLDKGEVIDYSSLKDIVNENGDEKFTRDGERLTWKSTGKDIYYKGKIEKELPITISSKYYLDGKLINPKDINKKKGHIKIELNFNNNSYDTKTGMYTPFVVDATTIISGDNTNITVTNGAVVSTGKSNVITAIASPGLYRSTGIDEFNTLDNITIEYDTDNYEFNEIYFVVTPKLLDKVDLNKLDKVDELNSSLNLLQSSMNQAVSGANQLAEGDSSLNEGLIALNNGLKDAVEGSTKITEGLTEVNNGISSFSNLTTMVTTLYEKYVNNEELIANIQSGVTAQQIQQQIQQATQEKTGYENQLIQVNAEIAQLEQLEQLTPEQQAKLDELYGQKAQLEGVIEQYAGAIVDAQNTLSNLPQSAAALSGADQVIAQVLTGLLGVPSMDYVNEQTINIFNQKINKLIGGINELTNGSSTLTNGLKEAYNGSNQLVDGSSKLNNGLNELKDGLNKLNEQGIKKLTSYGNTLVNYKNKLSSLTNLSKDYSGYSSNNANKATFIYKMSK